MQTKAINSAGKMVHITDFRTWEDAHSDTFTDQYGYGIPVTPHIRSDKRSSFCFYNSSGGGGCDGMTIEHIMAEKILAKRLNNPSQKFHVVYWSPKRMEIDLKQYYDIVKIEKKENGRIPDVLLVDSKGNYPSIFFEIWHTSRCSPQKIREGNLIIQIRINDYDQIFKYLHDWGIKESFLKEQHPSVRFYNFRERANELPWRDVLL